MIQNLIKTYGLIGLPSMRNLLLRIYVEISYEPLNPIVLYLAA
jgi:hypothetical protein